MAAVVDSPAMVGRPGMSRRGFLVAAAGAAAASALPAPRRRLLQMNGYPIDAETPLDALTTYLTPNDLFFVRHHWNPVLSRAGQVDAHGGRRGFEGGALFAGGVEGPAADDGHVRPAVRRKRPGSAAADRARRPMAARRRRQRAVDGGARARPAREGGAEGGRPAPPHVRNGRAAREGPAVSPQPRDREGSRGRHRRPRHERRAASPASRRAGASRRPGLGRRPLDEVARPPDGGARAADRLLHGHGVSLPEHARRAGSPGASAGDASGHRALRQVEHHAGAGADPVGPDGADPRLRLLRRAGHREGRGLRRRGSELEAGRARQGARSVRLAALVVSVPPEGGGARSRFTRARPTAAGASSRRTPSGIRAATSTTPGRPPRSRCTREAAGSLRNGRGRSRWPARFACDRLRTRRRRRPTFRSSAPSSASFRPVP